MHNKTTNVIPFMLYNPFPFWNFTAYTSEIFTFSDPKMVCCGLLKKFPGFIPMKQWGAMAYQRSSVDLWAKHNCDVVVGGSSKENC